MFCFVLFCCCCCFFESALQFYITKNAFLEIWRFKNGWWLFGHPVPLKLGWFYVILDVDVNDVFKLVREMYSHVLLMRGLIQYHLLVYSQTLCKSETNADYNNNQAMFKKMKLSSNTVQLQLWNYYIHLWTGFNVNEHLVIPVKEINVKRF